MKVLVLATKHKNDSQQLSEVTPGVIGITIFLEKFLKNETFNLFIVIKYSFVNKVVIFNYILGISTILNVNFLLQLYYIY